LVLFKPKPFLVGGGEGNKSNASVDRISRKGKKDQKLTKTNRTRIKTRPGDSRRGGDR